MLGRFHQAHFHFWGLHDQKQWGFLRKLVQVMLCQYELILCLLQCCPSRLQRLNNTSSIHHWIAETCSHLSKFWPSDWAVRMEVSSCKTFRSQISTHASSKSDTFVGARCVLSCTGDQIASRVHRHPRSLMRHCHTYGPTRQQMRIDSCSTWSCFHQSRIALILMNKKDMFPVGQFEHFSHCLRVVRFRGGHWIDERLFSWIVNSLFAFS